MGLDEFLEDESDEDSIETNTDKDTEKCPNCGSEGRHIVHIQYKCTNKKCETISWYISQ